MSTLVSQFPSASSSNAVAIQQLGFGAMGMSAFYATPVTQEEGSALLDQLISLPLQSEPTMIDTSNIYTRTPGNGDNERLIGHWIASNSSNRQKIFLATKFGIKADRTLGCSREDAIQSCQESLERLQTDVIDLFYCHRPDRNLGVESTAQGLKELKESGKVRFVGVSEFNLDELKRTNDIVHIDALQIELSPWTPDVLTNGIADWCSKNGTAVVAYSPLGRGALAGRFDSVADLPEDDWRRTNPRFQAEAFEKNLELVNAIKSIASKRGLTPGQVCLAWIMAQGQHYFPIPGTTNINRLQENAKAATVKLTADELRQVTEVTNQFKAVGDRYPAAMMAGTAF